MRLLVRLVVLAIVGLGAFALGGPMLPDGFFIREWAENMREVMNAWWGFPLGFGITSSP